MFVTSAAATIFDLPVYSAWAGLKRAGSKVLHVPSA